MNNICIAGKNQIAIDALSYLLHDLRINQKNIFVCPNRNDPGLDTWQPSFSLFGRNNNLNIVDLQDLYEQENLIFISLEFDRIIKPDRFRTDKLFNLHFSLLPAYKGVYTSIFPILNGEKQTGVTLHKIDPGIDTGDIIAQRPFNVDISDTARDLYYKYLRNGFLLFKSCIINLIDNTYSAEAQASIGSSYYSRNDLDLKKIMINLKKSSFQIHNQIRAFIFEEYQLPELGGKRILKSQLTSDKIEANYYEEKINQIILSGMDGYKILLNIK